ncbi:apolipoprotein lipid transfer particle isoform X2 [Rhodnius prolixus]|uniref:apolipoprotein lipid transfer particle isoform X2 n=1 Tax=Rhodnius prolixus TaxID=13249 RepID=UPI003D18F438
MNFSVNLSLKKRSSYLNICKILVSLIWLNVILMTNANYAKDPEICGNPKCREAIKFNYQTNMNYKYKYSVEISTNFDRTGSNSSNLFISALVSFSFKTHCEGVLQIKNSQISHSSNPQSTLGNKSEQFDQALTKYLLRFYFEDGTISQICPDENESIWALNIKKGILSSFQNTMERFDVDQHTYERDINGDCLVRYSFKEVNGTTLALVKSTELSSCTNRHQLYSIIPLTPYVFQKKYYKWTPMNSTVSCTQLIDHKIYKSVSCEEQHMLRLLRNQSNSPKTISKSKLTLVVEKASSHFESEQIESLGTVNKRDNLLFDHKRPMKATHDNLHECKKSILQLCELSQTVEFQPMYPDVFNKLIHTARDLTEQAMTKLYKESGDICFTGRKHMKDALPFIRNRASTKVMTDVILSQEISEQRRQDWLLIMAFFPRPDADTIDSVSKLMLLKNVDTSTMLTVTTLIHAYCQKYTNCQENVSILKVMEVQEKLLNTTAPTGIDNDITYSVLKSIGNAGVLTPTLLSTLNNYIENENLPTEIRLIALQSLRRLPCGSNDNLATSLFKNQSVTEELRIAAYLHIMRCPSYTILQVVKNVLENEENNQGSFIWSHLKTQMSSAFPSRVDIQAMLQDENLNNKFDKDFRTFSRNYEYSFFLNNLGIGVFTEMNVIFSHKSYIPRNIVSNVTVMIFGETINLMEINIYLEGIEQYVEKVFAESGTFNKDSLANILKIVRIARQAPNPLKYFIDNIPFKKIFDHLRVSISVKMFGNELKYYRINGHEEFVRILDYLNPTNFIKNFLGGQEMIYEKSTMLIDTSYVTPMANGLSLKLNAVGTAAININAMGFVNSTVPSSNVMEMSGRLYPSLGINFEGTLLVDAFFTQTGIRFKGTVYTSTAVEGSFLMDTYKLMRISLNLPLQKSDIFHAETELLLVTDENLMKLEDTSIGRQKKELCTWDLLDEIIGLKLCATSLFPDAVHIIQSPLLLFTGPINLELVLLKTDPSASMFIVEYEITAHTNKTIVKFRFNTPGSAIKRGVTADVVLDIQSQNITVAYSSTRSQVLAQGYYRNTPLQKLLNFSLDINGKKHVFVQIGLDITQGKYGNTYFPKFVFAINDKRIVNLSGSIKWVDKKGVSQCDINIDFQTNRFETIIMGYLRLGEASFGTDLTMHYRFGDSGQLENVVLKLELMDKSTKFLKYYQGQLSLKSTAYPHISSITSLKFRKAQNHVDYHLGMVTIANDNDTGTLHLNLAYEQYKAFSLNKVNTSLSVFKPSSDIDIKLGFIKQETSNNISAIILVKYATGKELVTMFDLNVPHGTLFYCESKLRVIVHAAVEQLSIFTKIWEKSVKEYDLEFTGVWFSGHNITLRGLYQDKSTLVLASHALKFLVRSQLFNDILFNGRLVNSEKEFKNDIQIEHNNFNYGLLLQHTNEEMRIYETYCKILYNTSIYSATNHLDLIKREIVLDLHFDQHRDVHMTLHSYTNNTHIDAGVGIKWDVNRDPSCKFTFLLQTKSSGRLNHDGRCIIEYPGRAVTSTFYILHSGIDYIISVRGDWSPKDAIKGNFRVITDLQKSGILKLDGRIETPFKKWEHIGLAYQLKVGTQMADCNGSLIWQSGQKLDMEASYSYLFTDSRTEVLVKTIVNSTIPTVTSLKAVIEYVQLEYEFNSEMFIQTSPKGIVAASCSGKVDYKDDLSRYLASFFLETPFLTLRKAGISAELSLYLDNKIKGILHLIGSGKKYITTLEASLKQWNESHMNFHISTPFEKYKVLSGKFSFSASRKHLLLDLRSSSILIGGEIVYIYNNISNFDLKLRTQTSFTFVNSVLVVGKINSDTVDLRVGWNTLVVGLIGSTHFTSFMDVDYSVQIFTPIEGYSKGSAIAKLIYSDRFDFEASVSLAEKKVGLKVQAMIRPLEDFAVPYSPEPAKVQKPVIAANDTNNSSKSGSDFTFESFIEQDLEPNETESDNLLDLTNTPLRLNEAPPGTVYWRGMFQLNTPLYPTVHGVAQINEDAFDYNFIMFLSFPFGQLKMTDDLTYKDFLNVQNYMKVQTTCKCLEELESGFNIKGSFGEYVNSRHETVREILHLNSELDIVGKVYNTSYKGNTEMEYDFFPFNDYYTEGVYNASLLIKTPFKILNHTYFNANLMTENPNYSGNITIEINNNTLSLDGTVEVDEKYLASNIGAKIHLNFFTLPMCRIILHKDFTDVEKKINLGLALPNERGDALVNYGVGGMWQYESPNFMKYVLEIVTPYPAIGKIKGSIEFSNDEGSDTSYLQAYLKYSNRTEIRASSVLNRNAVRFNIDSTYEIVKKIIINGKFTNKEGSNNFDAVYSSDREYKLVGLATVIPNHPFMVKVKLYKTKENEELLDAVLNINKKQGGYEISASLQRHGHTFNLDCDFIELGNEGKQFDVMLSTSYPDYESLTLRTLLLNKNYELMMSKVKGRVVSKFIASDLSLNVNISLKEDAGIVDMVLLTDNLLANAKITWIFNWVENIWMNVDGELTYEDVTKELVSKLHVWNVDSKYQKTSFNVDVNYNNYDWWLCSNATLLFPKWSDIQFAAFVILPYSGLEPAHRLLGKLKYQDDFTYAAHIINYISTTANFDFQTLSELISTKYSTKGAFLVQTGKHKIYDNFLIKHHGQTSNVWNLLQSTNMEHDLLLELVYKNVNPAQHANLLIFYPKPVTLVKANLDFTSIKNLYARMNFSTPFKAFPEVQSYLNIVTNKDFYQRLAEIKWLKNQAVFNFTQVSTWLRKIQLTDGSMLLEFPLATRHVGLLSYTYESSDMKANGQSSLAYNGDIIMSGNYTRDSEKTAKRNKDKIIINVNNSFMPLGIIYNHKLYCFDSESKWASQDFKSVELFRLNHNLDFSIIGEIQFNWNEVDKLTTFRAFHSTRRFILETLTEGDKKHVTTANFTLNPNVWFATGWKSVNKEQMNGREMEFNISYPKRFFSLNGEYLWEEDSLKIQATANPNLYTAANSLTGVALWDYFASNNTHLLTLILAHPSLSQNISVVGSYHKNENVLCNLFLNIKYAKDLSRKVFLNMTAIQKSVKPIKHYALNFYGSHPASRLKLIGKGNIKFGEKFLAFNKNISYMRSYMPLQFWIASGEINVLKKLIELQRKSLRDFSHLRAMYGNRGSYYFAKATMLKDKNLTVDSDFYMDINNYKTELSMNFTSNATQRLRMLGSYSDNRDLKFIIWRTIYTFDVNDLKILARLNSSRMFTSSVTWRPEIHSELMGLIHSTANYLWNYAVETTDFWTQYIRLETIDTLTDVWFDAKPLLQDFLHDLRDMRHLQQDVKYFQRIFNESYAANEFYMKDIYEMYQILTEEISFKDKMSNVPKIVNELWEVMGETGETIRQSVLWLVESMRNLYERIVKVLNGLATGETMEQISQYLQGVASKYDKIIKEMHISFLHYMEELWNETGNVIAQYWLRTLRTIEPTFIQFAHHIENVFWEGSKKVLEFLYEKQSELMRNTVFRANSNFTKDMEKFYDDITKNDFLTNLKKYTRMLYDIVTEKYFTVVPFSYELNEIRTEIVGEVKELYKLPVINFTLQLYKDVQKQVNWLYDYLEVQEKVQTVIPIIYNLIRNYSNTALDNEMINHASRTNFIFKPEAGIIFLEQKLPVPWHAFNATPNLAEIPEYKTIITVHKFFSPVNGSFWSYYYVFAPLVDPSNWLPPFSSQALIIGSQRLITFDGVSYDLPGRCSYLLARDFLYDTFSLVLMAKDVDEVVIALMVYDRMLNIDLSNNVVSVDNEQIPSLPLNISDVYIYAQEGIISVKGAKGFLLRCNFKFSVCTFKLSGWYFGKVAGLLGTMDNEPKTDFTASDHEIKEDLHPFVDSWILNTCSEPLIDNRYLEPVDPRNNDLCYQLYSVKTSTFAPCYSIVNPQPFYSICLHKSQNIFIDEICTSAYAYIQACNFNYIPIKVPTFCVECPVNKSLLEEGFHIILENESVLQSSDIIFIVEAKSCNEYMRERRIVSTFVSILTKELQAMGLDDNRYAVVTFGGNGIYDEPRNIFINNQIFTHGKDLSRYFEKIPSGNGNSDIFGALRFASKLQFRPGVSKTFILMPCSDCDTSSMTVEYGVLNQEFIEKNITLHILMNADFDLEKLRVNKMFYGLDSERAYTKNDFKVLRGDIELRRQIKLTRSMMGYCTTLALETNGTIFTGKKMGSENIALVKKFSSVFSRRIAATAQPDSCQTCECSSDNDGIEYVECAPCSIPVPAYSDFDFRDNGTLSFLHALEHHAGDVMR